MTSSLVLMSSQLFVTIYHIYHVCSDITDQGDVLVMEYATKFLWKIVYMYNERKKIDFYFILELKQQHFRLSPGWFFSVWRSCGGWEDERGRRWEENDEEQEAGWLVGRLASRLKGPQARSVCPSWQRVTPGWTLRPPPLKPFSC